MLGKLRLPESGKRKKILKERYMISKKHKISVILLLMVASVLVWTSVSTAQALAAFKGEKGDIRISGGTAHIPVMKEAAKRIMTANPEIHISIAGGGSGVGPGFCHGDHGR